MRLLEEDEDLNPAAAVVNLVDVFLVIIGALLISIAQNPLNPFNADKVTVIKDAGTPQMEITIKKGKKIERFKATGEIGSGDGVKAGVAYQLKDGSLVYVPEKN